jgi:hypothetical protein
MTIVLVFVILYMALSLWDVAHVNSLFDNMVNPGPRKPVKALPPAPLLDINLPPK